MIVSSKVTADFKHLPVIDYLAGRFGYLSREAWLMRIAEGRIRCNGAVCTAETIVTQGDVVAYEMPLPPLTDIPQHPVLYEDEWLLAVNKPAGLMVHAQGPFVQQNLIFHLRQRWPDDELHLVNRLDMDTTGLIWLAKGKETLRLMSQQFAQTAVSKTYLAIVHGVPDPAAGTIDLPLKKLPKDDGPPRFAVAEIGEGKTAVSAYELVDIKNKTFALLRLFPQTGRTHQLRVHCAALGCPIVGDKVYGKPDSAPRHFLHCSATTLTHPQTQRPLTVKAPLAKDMELFWERDEL